MELSVIIDNCVLMLSNPPKAIAGLKKATLADGAAAVALGGFVTGIVMSFLMAGMWGMMRMMGFGWTAPSFGLFSVYSLVAVPAIAVIGWFACSLISYLAASVLGGRGTFGQFATAWAFALAPVVALAWVPVINILLALYALYILYWIMRSTMRMLPGNAMLAVVFLVLLWFAVWSGLGAGMRAMWYW